MRRRGKQGRRSYGARAAMGLLAKAGQERRGEHKQSQRKGRPSPGDA